MHYIVFLIIFKLKDHFGKVLRKSRQNLQNPTKVVLRGFAVVDDFDLYWQVSKYPLEIIPTVRFVHARVIIRGLQ